MTKVVSLNGDAVVEAAGEPSPALIARLEDLLEQARSGEVQGIAYAALHADRLASFAVAGRVGGYAMMGALTMAQDALVRVNGED